MVDDDTAIWLGGFVVLELDSEIIGILFSFGKGIRRVWGTFSQWLSGVEGDLEILWCTLQSRSGQFISTINSLDMFGIFYRSKLIIADRR